jgi:predicted O-methyltransferase YrrM
VIDAAKRAVMRAITAVLARLPEAWRARGNEALWRYGIMRLPNHRVTRRYVRRFGLTVRRGPFQGLEFPKEVVGRNPFLTSKLIGSYEAELHPWVERLAQQPFRRVLDVGAADGFYVAGFARRLPQAKIIAWEADPLQAQLTRLTAERNGVADRVDLRGLCRIEDLAALDGDEPSLVIIDAEGAEDELLDPERAPALRDATVIVEVHEMYAPGVTERLRERFSATHRIEELRDRPRYRDDYPELYELQVDNLERDLAVTESRIGVTPWLLIEPRATSGQTVR